MQDGSISLTCNTIAPRPAIKTTKSIGLYPNNDPAWRSTLQFPLFICFRMTSHSSTQSLHSRVKVRYSADDAYSYVFRYMLVDGPGAV